MLGSERENKDCIVLMHKWPDAFYIFAVELLEHLNQQAVANAQGEADTSKQSYACSKHTVG